MNSLRLTLQLYVVLCVGASFSQAFSAPTMGLGAVLFKPAGMKTEPSRGTDDVLIEASDFFTDAFWAAKVGGGVKQLQPKQRTSLLNSQMMEFRRRYGMKYGDRRAELLITRNGKGDVMGCCGIEVDKIPEKGLSGRIITSAPLMSNVAVGRKFRRRGIAEEMVYRAEELARKDWGYDEVYLYVEKRNSPALKLYQKLGYKRLWEDSTANTLMPVSTGGMKQVPTTLVCMRKKLNRGLLGRLLNF
jgi:RimJ/RimL family protein N-acetyltransferase